MSGCPFCNIEKERYIAENEFSFAVYDIHPVTKGHTLIIPKNHIQNYFDLPEKEQESLWQLLNSVKKLLGEKYQPDGFNVGININRSAGQSVMHSHIHIIPRYIRFSRRGYGIEEVVKKSL